jgi:DNA-binding PadR family transcriptional regulator
MRGDHVRGHLDLLLLTVLRRGPAHGYAVLTALRDQSDGAFDLPEGTIYPALHRLERAGWVTSSWDATSGRRRRVYALTDAGRAECAEQRNEWRGLVSGMQAVIGGAPA